MAQSERNALIARSAIVLEEFVRHHPHYSIDVDQPVARGGTNLVTFGHAGKQPVVFKYFIRPYRWTHEYFCLRHFAQTGYVPQVLQVVPEELIVMTRLPDSLVGAAALPEKAKVSYEIGQAVATVVQWPLPTAENRPLIQSEFEQFAWRSDLGELMRDSLARCWRIQEQVLAYQTPFFTESLTFAEQQIDFIDQQPRILFHEDIPNFCVAQGRFQGFYDLEMVRIGTEALQLGVALDLCRNQQSGEEWMGWSDFLQGYQATTGRTLSTTDFQALLAMNHFYYHIRLCRWGKWDGDPTQTASLHFATSKATHYLHMMKMACYQVREWVDLPRWFPSLQ